MNRTYFILCLSVAICLNSHGQRKRDKITFGLKAGLNLVSVNNPTSFGAPFPADSRKTFFAAGGFAYLPLGKQLALQPELLYSGMSFNTLGPADGIVGNHNKYAYMPLLLQWHPVRKLYAETGPQAAILLRATSGYPGEEQYHVKDNFKSMDFSWVVGAGYTHHKGLGVDFRYTIGLTGIDQEFFHSYGAGKGMLSATIFYRF